MRRSKAEKAITHSKILAIAAKRFRERGLNGIGVAEVMEEAGSSAGGFYKHFSSRNDLVVESLAEAFTFLDELATRSDTLEEYFNAMLSEAHFNNPGSGCALTALTGDVVHAVPAARTLYSQRVKQTLAYYADRLAGVSPEILKTRAVLLLSACVGGLAIARASNDAKLSQEILESLRIEIQQLIKPGAKVKASMKVNMRKVRR